MQHLLVLLVALLLLSCGGEKKGTSETANTETEAPKVSKPKVDIRQRELDSGIRNDTIYLKYRLGMSREAFQAHSKAMADSGKLASGVAYYLKDDDPIPIRINVDLPYPMMEMRYTFDDEDKLYSIALEALHDDIDWRYDELVELYKLSYGEPGDVIEIIPKDDVIGALKADVYEWYDGNREIRISATEYKGVVMVRVTYKDMANDYDPYAKYNDQPLEKSDDI